MKRHIFYISWRAISRVFILSRWDGILVLVDENPGRTTNTKTEGMRQSEFIVYLLDFIKVAKDTDKYEKED